jgi:hypothetical protein
LGRSATAKKNNNSVISNNSVEHRGLLLIFKFPMGTQKNFLEIYRQLEHAPSKTFTNPGLELALTNHNSFN